MHYTDWDIFKTKMESACTTLTETEGFVAAINSSTSEATKTVNMTNPPTAIDGEYERLRAIRRRAERRARKTKSAEDVRASRRAQKRVIRHLDKLSKKRWRSLSAGLDPRKPVTRIWPMMRSLRVRPQQVRPFRAIALGRQVSAVTIAEEFCVKITSCSTLIDCRVNTTDDHPSVSVCKAVEAYFTLKELDMALFASNVKSSPGTDGIRYSALRHLGEAARTFLLKAFNSSWETGIIPRQWKIARVLPILKPGKFPLDINSYRPIALTSCMSKVMERMVLARMEWDLENRGLYPSSMNGFRRGKSRIDNVTDLVTSIEQTKTDRKSVV